MAVTSPPAADPAVVIEFLEQTLPFSEMEDPARKALARECVIDFASKGTVLYAQGDQPPDSLFLIQKGGVKLYLVGDNGEETLIDYRGEGGAVGALTLIQGGPSTLSAETVEDTFFFRLRKETFILAVEQYPCVAQHFLKAFSERYINKAFAELRQRKASFSCDTGLYLFNAKVGELVGREPVSTEMGGTIRHAAMRMTEQKVGSVLIREPSGEICGIVTDTDLRTAVALGMDFEAPIETLMTTPVVAADDRELCFDALLRMMSENIHHLAVRRGGEIVGVVTSHDLMVLQGRSPLSVFREIKMQTRIEGLYPISDVVPHVIRTLVEEGAKASHVTRMMTILNDLILEKLMDLLLKELGPAPAPFCWLLMGSEGRREQTFKTDQDNALVYKAFQDEDDIVERAAALYFQVFSRKAIDHLVKCGFPSCPGDIMASNDRWRQPFDVWRDYFESWIARPEPEEVMNAAIFFDFRSGYGNGEFARELRDHVARHARREEVFLRYLAANCLETRPPLSIFKSFLVEKDGEHRNRMDIKKRGIVPFVDFARVMALKAGIKETNTLDRLDLLAQDEHMPRDLFNNMRDAFEFLLQLRLVHQLEQVEQGMQPDNFIEPSRLSEVEKRTLKEAFAVIGQLQGFLRDMFRLNI